MQNPNWPALGLTDELIEELYRRGRAYVAQYIAPSHREDAVQDGMCDVLKAAMNGCPADSEERLKYLTKTLFNAAMKRVTRKTPPDTNIPTET